MTKPIKQCKTCPWRVGSDTKDIPNYSKELHKGLTSTIASDTRQYVQLASSSIRMMACHRSKEDAPTVCAGWASNQLGPGNNLALRMVAIRDPRFHGPLVDGPQHPNLESTIPED